MSRFGPSSVRQIWVLMATVFVDMIGFTIVMPLLPFYATNLGAKPWLVGPLIAVFAFAQLVTAPLWGKLSDRYGRRPMIILGLVISAVSYVVFGLAHTLWLLFVSRLVQGMGSGTTGVVQAYVSDSIVPEERATALGWVTAATSAGVMIGPAIGSFANHLGSAAPGFVAAGLCVLNVLSALIWLPESNRRDGAASHETERRSLWTAILEVLHEPGSPVSALIWIYSIGMLAFMSMNSVLGLYLKDAFKITADTVGPFYTFIGLVGVLMRAVLLGPAVRRFGEVGTMRLGALSMTLGMALAPLPSLLPAASAGLRIGAMVFVLLFLPVGTALLFPSSTALVSRRSRKGETGQVMGVQQAFGGVARLIGPIWSTWVFGINLHYPFWISSVLMLGACLLTLRLQRERPSAALREPVPADAAPIAPR